MTGTPVFSQLCATIEANGGDDWFFDELATLGKPKLLADQLGCSRQLLYKWRKNGVGRLDRWREAMKHGAEIRLDDADELMDSMPTGRDVTPGQVAAIKSKAEWAKSMAEKLDPERFDKRGADAGNAAAMLLEVFREAQLRRQDERRLLPIPEVKAEVIDG